MVWKAAVSVRRICYERLERLQSETDHKRTLVSSRHFVDRTFVALFKKKKNYLEALTDGSAYQLDGLVVNFLPGERELWGSSPASPTQVTPGTGQLVLWPLLCQAPGVIGSVLALVGPVLVCCD